MSDIAYNALREQVEMLRKQCLALVEKGFLESGGLEGAAAAELKPLKIAFVGQYSAGKSSLIKMLTGLDEIGVGAGVTTKTTSEYAYKGLSLLDTPGIRAGDCETHDAQAEQAMRDADLLIFVITNELFDDVLGREFRRLCFTLKREKEMLLVVNKTQSDPGLRQTKLDGIRMALEPLEPERFPIVFTDAECYFEALEEEDPRERAELLQRSGYEPLQRAIDRFVAERGLYARLTTPLQHLRSALERTLDELRPGEPIEKDMTRLCSQKQQLIERHRRLGEEALKGRIDAAHGGIIGQGDELIFLVGSEDYEARAQKSNELYQDVLRNCIRELDEILESSVQNLNSEAAALAETPLANRIKIALEAAEAARLAAGGFVDEEETLQLTASSGAPLFNVGSVKHVADAIGYKGWRLAESAVNRTPTGRIVSSGLRAASGSELHGIVKNTGHFFGHKFKPWEAVKYTDKIGSTARSVSAVAFVIGPALQLLQDYREKQEEAKTAKARGEIRKTFHDLANRKRSELRHLAIERIHKLYAAPLEALEEILEDIRSRNEDKTEIGAELQRQLDQIIHVQKLAVLAQPEL